MQIVEIFINELSWNIGNYKDNNSLRKSIDTFRTMLSLILDKNKSYSNLNLFFNGQGLNAFLKDEFITEYEYDNLEQIKRHLLSSKDWQETEYKLHKGQDNFYHLNLLDNALELVNNTSLAEITHRNIEKEDCTFLILNFGNSPYGREKFLSLIRKSHTKLPQITHIQQIDNFEELKKWLREEIEWKNITEQYNSITEIWENREEIFPNLIFCGDTQKQLGTFGIKDKELRTIFEKLNVLDNYLANNTQLNFDDLNLDISPESSSTMQKYGNLRQFRLLNGDIETFTLHIKLSNLRIHIFPNNKGKCYIGYIGKHLPTKKFN